MFQVNETAVVHCGFYSENGGFKVSTEDKNYMQTCKIVVSTWAFGGGDDLYQPINMSEASLKKVCYVAFWDDITLQTQEAGGKRIDENHKIGKWRIVVVKDLPFADQRLNGKIPKVEQIAYCLIVAFGFSKKAKYRKSLSSSTTPVAAAAGGAHTPSPNSAVLSTASKNPVTADYNFASDFTDGTRAPIEASAIELSLSRSSTLKEQECISL
ncbi:probable hexosyltransferase MUCI70 [Telopea speciosissima]|uniref:probable hexosyltransferase MUCI70 n=1 Tax=Telopea speciosissima TaxID=54955 RepID=UPI001CC59969|nr:probable hexosyltransferase MUCI70 [Telopea speciosissima]